MIDPELLLIKAVQEVLDDLGIAPEADEQTAKDLITELAERGYVITRKVEAKSDENEEGDRQ